MNQAVPRPVIEHYSATETQITAPKLRASTEAIEEVRRTAF